MKKPASPKPTEKRAKRTPEEKTARKSAKNAGRATADLKDDRADKKASQKKSLKSAAKQLQKELNNRMNEVVTRIRKETKAKLKEVVKEATRRLDGDTERMFEQALHTIVRHYDSVSGTSGASTVDGGTAASNGKAPRAKKGQTLNKDGSPRKPRVLRAEATSAADASNTAIENPTAKTRGRKPSATAAKAKTTGARRGPKPTAATPAAGATAASRRGPKPGTPATGARRGPKPRVQDTPAPEANGVMNSADSPGTGEVSA